MKPKFILTALLATAGLSAGALDYSYTPLRCTSDAVYRAAGKYVELYVSRDEITLAKVGNLSALDAEITSYASLNGTTMFTYADSGQAGAIYVTDVSGDVRPSIPGILQDIIGDGYAQPSIRLFQSQDEPACIFACFTNRDGECYNIMSDDFGDSWQMTGLTRPAICMSMKNDAVYAAVPGDNDRLSIVRSDDRGMTWTAVTTLPRPLDSILDIDISDISDSLIAVTCDSPFVYDSDTGTTTFISEDVEERYRPIRRYGFVHDSTDLMTFNASGRTLDTSSDCFITRTSHEYPGPIGIAERIDGWVRSGDRIYAHCAQTRAILDLDYDAVVASCLPAAADYDTDVTVRDLNGRTVLRCSGIDTASRSLPPGIYIVTTGNTTSKVAVR